MNLVLKSLVLLLVTCFSAVYSQNACTYMSCSAPNGLCVLSPDGLTGSCQCYGLYTGSNCENRKSIIFVSKNKYSSIFTDYFSQDPNFALYANKPLLAADHLCQLEGAFPNPESLTYPLGTQSASVIWRAFLSSGTDSPNSRFSKNSVSNYVGRVNTQLYTLALDWTDLVTNGLQTTIITSDSLMTGLTTETWWTGSNKDGTEHSPQSDCVQWTSNWPTNIATIGVNAPGRVFASSSHMPCSGLHNLLCVMQVNNSIACASSPCLNSGICLPHTFNDGNSEMFTCRCQPGFSGTLCNININECSSSPCLNGGTCLDFVNKFECQCPPLYEGRLCELYNSADECASNPCSHNATCIDTFERFICNCQSNIYSRWSGPTCSQCDTNQYGLCNNAQECVELISPEYCGSCTNQCQSGQYCNSVTHTCMTPSSE